MGLSDTVGVTDGSWEGSADGLDVGDAEGSSVVVASVGLLLGPLLVEGDSLGVRDGRSEDTSCTESGWSPVEPIDEVGSNVDATGEIVGVLVVVVAVGCAVTMTFVFCNAVGAVVIGPVVGAAVVTIEIVGDGVVGDPGTITVTHSLGIPAQ